MERTLLLSIEDWQNWYADKVSAWGNDICVQSYADTDTPTEFPCIVIENENLDESGYGFSCYDFIYKKDVETLFN